jgi:hypothetical protein
MGANETVCEFSRPYRRVGTRYVLPDGTGYVRGLYAIDDIDPNIVNAIENLFLKPSDGMAAEALHCFLREEQFTHPVRMRHVWTRFVLSLLIRYPEAIAHMKKQLRENVERMYLEHRKPDEPETFAEFDAQRGMNELAQRSSPKRWQARAKMTDRRSQRTGLSWVGGGGSGSDFQHSPGSQGPASRQNRPSDELRARPERKFGACALLPRSPESYRIASGRAEGFPAVTLVWSFPGLAPDVESIRKILDKWASVSIRAYRPGMGASTPCRPRLAPLRPGTAAPSILRVEGLASEPLAKGISMDRI